MTEVTSPAIRNGRLTRRLMVVVGVVVVGYYMVINPYNKDTINIVLGALMLTLGMIPLWRWLGRRGPVEIPVLALHGLFYSVCFGFAGFITPVKFMGELTVTEAENTAALCAALLSWGALCLGYWLVSGRTRRLQTWFLDIESRRLNEAVVLVAYPALILFSIADARLGLALDQIISAMRLIAFVWALFSALRGELSRRARILVWFLLVPVEILLFAGFDEARLLGLLVYGQILGVSLAVGRRVVYPAMAVFVVVAFALLDPVKAEVRTITWSKTAEPTSIADRLGIFATVAAQRYLGSGSSIAHSDGLVDESFSRINHLHTLSAVVADTPRRVEYSHGETLLPLLTKWIPRAVWPDKPLENLGNRWAHKYGYLGAMDDVTAYNLPWVPEMFMNFGWLGVGSLSLMIGALIGWVRNSLIVGASTPARYSLALLVSSSFFFPESNISLEIGGMIVSAVSGAVFIAALVLITKTKAARQ